MPPGRSRMTKTQAMHWLVATYRCTGWQPGRDSQQHALLPARLQSRHWPCLLSSSLAPRNPTPQITATSHMALLVEGKLSVSLLDVRLVALLNVLGQDDVPAQQQAGAAAFSMHAHRCSPSAASGQGPDQYKPDD